MIDCELSPQEISQIVSFLGYGSPSADVWFVGMEEGIGGMSSTDTCKNLKARATFGKTMDLREAHLSLLQGGVPIDVEKNTPSTQVWQFMSKIMLARDGKEWRTPEVYKKYVQFSLGRVHGETFLTEISPIPSKNSTGNEWKKFFMEKDPGLEAKLKQRDKELMNRIQDRTKGHNPPLVICYGLGKKKRFAELLGGIEWGFICEKIYASHDRKCLLVPFLGTGQMSHKVVEKMLQHGLLTNQKAKKQLPLAPHQRCPSARGQYPQTD